MSTTIVAYTAALNDKCRARFQSEKVGKSLYNIEGSTGICVGTYPDSHSRTI